MKKSPQRIAGNRLMSGCRSLLLGLCCLLISPGVWAHGPVTLVGGEIAPYAYHGQQQITGFGVEVMREIALRTGHTDEVVLMPFKRAFLTAQTRPDLLMMPVARIPEREGLVQWVIHLIDDSFFYVTRAGKLPMTHTEARQGAVIGVLGGSAPLAVLQGSGVKQFLEQTLDASNINMLRLGRIDGWFTSALLLNGAFRANPELNPQDFVIGPVQSRHCVYVVAAITTSASAVAPWQAGFEAIRADGTYQKILDRYLDRPLQEMVSLDSPDAHRCEHRQ